MGHPSYFHVASRDAILLSEENSPAVKDKHGYAGMRKCIRDRSGGNLDRAVHRNDSIRVYFIVTVVEAIRL